MSDPKLVSTWILESDRDKLKVEAAKRKKTMYQIISELIDHEGFGD